MAVYYYENKNEKAEREPKKIYLRHLDRSAFTLSYLAVFIQVL